MLARRKRRTHTPGRMKESARNGPGSACRAFVAAGCIVAVLFALVLSAVPHLHERVHGATTSSNHECAVTLLTSGNYQHTVTVAISLAPPAPPALFAHAFDAFPLLGQHLEFSLLEHAPPAVS